MRGLRCDLSDNERCDNLNDGSESEPESGGVELGNLTTTGDEIDEFLDNTDQNDTDEDEEIIGEVLSCWRAAKAFFGCHLWCTRV